MALAYQVWQAWIRRMLHPFYRVFVTASFQGFKFVCCLGSMVPTCDADTLDEILFGKLRLQRIAAIIAPRDAPTVGDRNEHNRGCQCDRQIFLWHLITVDSCGI